MKLSYLLNELAGDPPPSAFTGQTSVYSNYDVGWPKLKTDDVVLHGSDGKQIWKCSHDHGRDLANSGKIRWHDNESVIRYLLQLGVL